MAVHDIVIVGGSFAGLGVAHYLLRHTLPKLESSNTSQTYKITLISTTDQFLFKIAAPRTVASPDMIPVSKILRPIAEGFKEYPADHFKHVVGTAVSVDEGKKTVSVKRSDGSITALSYNSIVCATGTTSKSPLWTLHDSPEESIAEFKRFHEKLPKAESMLVVGGGPAGVETVGELASAFPKRDITILSGSSRLLTRLKPAIGQGAESYLSKVGVKTRHELRVVSSHSEGTKTVANLSDGTSMTVDVYIDATGGTPNAGWIPKAWLTSDNKVLVDSTTLRNPHAGVYAIGDIASYSQGAALDIVDAVKPLCSSIGADLSPDPKPKQDLFKQTLSQTQLVPIGQKGGVGILFGWKIPSLMVWLVKGRSYFIEKAMGTVEGKDYLKA